MTDLVIFSGGIDSTYSLYQVLRTRDTDVKALHVSLIDSTHKSEVERAAVNRIVNWLRTNVRDFELITLKQYYPEPYPILDVLLVAPMAGSIIQSDSTIDNVWMATNDDDLAKLEAEGGWVQPFENTVKVFMSAYHDDRTIRFNRAEASKSKIIESLPDSLLEMTTSCRRPNPDGTGCGECGKCKERKQ